MNDVSYMASVYTYAEFQCGHCNTSLSLTVEEVSTLTGGDARGCTCCQSIVEVGTAGQATLTKIDKYLVQSGKLLLIFSVIWFPAYLIISFFYSTLILGGRAVLGLLIAMASRSLLAGAGFKPSGAAAFKRRGGERPLEKAPMMASGKQVETLGRIGVFNRTLNPLRRVNPNIICNIYFLRHLDALLESAYHQEGLSE